MTGRFIAIVGPSGVGKDSVMRALAARDARFVLARRIITRPADAGGEAFDSLTPAEFDARRAQGAFALHWPAHGLHYAIPAQVDDDLAAGRHVLANLSRAVLAQAHTRFTRCDVILLTADPETLATRLHDRGRETGDDIARRLKRADFALPDGISAHVVANTGALDQTVDRVLACLSPLTPVPTPEGTSS